MTWSNRLRLTAGTLAVLLTVGVFTLVFSQRQDHASSTSATIAADTYTVGTDYGGTVVKQLVEPGDTVDEGDPLFVIQSLVLQQDVAQGIVDQAESAAFSILDDGKMVFFAPVDGTVSEMKAKEGAFIPAGGSAAEIERKGSLFVLADFTLSPQDYERIEPGAEVELLLPDRRTFQGVVESLSVETVDGQALTQVRVQTDDLQRATDSGLVRTGTPVEATLSLRDDGIFSGALDGVRDFLRKIGL